VVKRYRWAYLERSPAKRDHNFSPPRQALLALQAQAAANKPSDKKSAGKMQPADCQPIDGYMPPVLQNRELLSVSLPVTDK
jgi:hypothetical protein